MFPILPLVKTSEIVGKQVTTFELYSFNAAVNSFKFTTFQQGSVVYRLVNKHPELVRNKCELNLPFFPP